MPLRLETSATAVQASPAGPDPCGDPQRRQRGGRELDHRGGGGHSRGVAALGPLDMRAGTDTAWGDGCLRRSAVHNAYLITNKRANRLKVLVHDGLGIWL